ncbi:hypothetical protein LWI29_029811 [Acer saccharum]|uniref:Uncharacterized protein n=1 Tax=Acer saccharum TaxID=4024 RepID=A0AA39SGF0_ACESA|nr:hypothetical protein LWI29_029811 [Acer saccharum]
MSLKSEHIKHRIKLNRHLVLHFYIIIVTFFVCYSELVWGSKALVSEIKASHKEVERMSQEQRLSHLLPFKVLGSYYSNIEDLTGCHNQNTAKLNQMGPVKLNQVQSSLNSLRWAGRVQMLP